MGSGFWKSDPILFCTALVAVSVDFEDYPVIIRR